MVECVRLQGKWVFEFLLASSDGKSPKFKEKQDGIALPSLSGNILTMGSNFLPKIFHSSFSSEGKMLVESSLPLAVCDFFPLETLSNQGGGEALIWKIMGVP